jgi:cytoskeletal protein RodZ
MSAVAGNVIGFQGTLVGRKQIPGKKYIQLVFSTAEGSRLSISRNLRMARSLEVGHTYQIQGTEYSLGEKTYINEPVAKPVTTNSFFKTHLKLIIFFVCIGLVVCVSASVWIFGNHASTKQAAASPNAANEVQKPAAVAPTSATLGASTTQATAAPTTPAPSTPVKTSKSTTKTTAAKPVAAAPATKPATSQTPPAPTQTSVKSDTTTPTDTQTPADQQAPSSDTTTDPGPVDPGT